ncbi:unnamed protein product [Lupinus luteus]|uniref:FAD-binding PCMH-type domain-containing protein n=1 Tax=Lupinus luteus TaxID=3873 RepID=A0AAV1WRY3_LUPLU
METFSFLMSTITIMLSIVQAASGSPNENFLKCLSHHSKTPNPVSDVVFTQSNNSFSAILNMHIQNKRFKATTTPKLLAIVTAQHKSHVRTTILCAKTHGIQIRIRSGGHDIEGLSYVSDVPYVVLDLFPLHSVHVDKSSATARVEAGATLGQLYYHIYKKSKVHAFPAGVATSIGTGGHFSGGGYGNLMRKYGLSVDNIIDAKIVDANVTVFTVNKIVEDGATDVLYKWQEVAPNLDQDLFIRVEHSVVNGTKGGKKTVQLSFIGEFLGTIDRLLPLVNGDEANNPDLNISRSFYDLMAPYASNSPRETFHKYRDVDIGANHPSNTTSLDIARTYGSKYFKQNFDRLMQVKSRVDPLNFFRYEQSIPPKSSN